MRARICRQTLAAVLAAVALQAAASEQGVRNRVALGALVFAENCKSCHQIDGYGEEALYPSLRDATLLADERLLITTVLHGRLARGKDGAETKRLMPSMDFLTNREIAAIIAFITNSWGAEVLMVTEERIESAR